MAQTDFQRYSLVPWQGAPLAQGAQVMVQSTGWLIYGGGGYVGTAVHWGVRQWSLNPQQPVGPYVLGCSGQAAATFTVDALPLGPGYEMPGNDPAIGDVQMMVLVAPGGAYLTIDATGCYYAGSDQPNARVFILDRSQGATTTFYDFGFSYAQAGGMSGQMQQLTTYSPVMTQFNAPPPVLQWQQGFTLYTQLYVLADNGGNALDGATLIDAADGGATYIVLDGLLRLLPDAATQAALYGNVARGVAIDPASGFYPCGLPLVGAYLADGTPDGRVFLIVDGTRRWIIDPPVFERFGFNWNAIRTLPAATLDAIPEGPQIA